MSRPNLQLRIAPSAPLGYGLAILSVAIASGFAFPAQTLHVHDVAGPICLIGIAVTAWYAGSGPALLAVVISITFFDYFFVEPHYSLTTTLADLLYLIIFIAFASLVAWFTAVRRRVERDLRDARDYLYSRGKYQSRSSDNPAVILLDLKLPKVDGLEVLKQIKSDAKLKMIPVVVLTSSKEEKDMVTSYKLGVNAYVVKPVDFHEFVNAIKELGVFWAVINQPPPGSVRK
jgi:CheY-like chemotaxis protein